MDHAIEQLAALVERINGGRWRGADAVLRILEEDPAVDEVSRRTANWMTSGGKP